LQSSNRLVDEADVLPLSFSGSTHPALYHDGPPRLTGPGTIQREHQRHEGTVRLRERVKTIASIRAVAITERPQVSSVGFWRVHLAGQLGRAVAGKALSANRGVEQL
jgi:hypothetical protein